MQSKLITWEQFISTNIDARGVCFKFEDLCRQLFTNEFLSNNKKTRCVHCNPNNPGLESDPVYDEQNQRWIGYQAKFFEKRPGYAQILHSAQETVEYYGEKVNHVYLYSNEQLSADAEDLKKAVDILKKNNITLELITGDVILDQVRKYPYLASYYFGNHIITHSWIVNYNKRMFEELGERFNSEFNVDTDYSMQVSLFVHGKEAIKYINQKKENLIGQIDSLNWQYDQYREYLNKVKRIVSKLADIGYDDIEKAFKWEDDVKAIVERELGEFQTTKAELEEKQNELHILAFESRNALQNENERDREKYFDIGRKIKIIDVLLGLPEFLSISTFEHQLICG